MYSDLLDWQLILTLRMGKHLAVFFLVKEDLLKAVILNGLRNLAIVLTFEKCRLVLELPDILFQNVHIQKLISIGC